MERNSKVVSYLQAFNENHKGYHASSTVIEYLDAQYPQWQNEIKNKDEWKSVFDFDIHIYQNTWLQHFAEALFAIIDGTEVLEFVWRDKSFNEFYRYAAILKLRELDESKYLPEYVESLKRAEMTLGGWGYLMINEIFDFPDAVEVALEMYQNSTDRFDDKVRNLSSAFLTSSACQNWEKYPDDLKDVIINTHNYSILKNCTPQMWAILSLPHKFRLVHEIIIEEYKKIHDLLSLYKYAEEKEDRYLFFFENWDINNLKHTNNDRDLNRRLQEIFNHPSFDKPTINRRTNEYIPSMLLQNFMRLSDEAGDNILYKMLSRARNELTHLMYQH